MPRSIAIACPQLGDDEIAAVVRVLKSGRLTQGAEVNAFETEFSELVGGLYCVAVNSGTSALYLLMLALGIGRGAEVIVPSFTFAATANVVSLSGGTPVFVDIEPDTFCVAPSAVAAAVTSRTSAIVAVHLYGHPASVDQLAMIADHHGLALIEDAAQAHAASLFGGPVGTFGVGAAFSFYATKNLQTIEGGMVTTADSALARYLRLLRNHGMEERYRHEAIGINARMNEVAAAIGRVQLRSLPERTAARRANAARLDKLLPQDMTPHVRPGARHVYHQYTVRVPDQRDVMRKHLARDGVASAVHYPVPLHRTPPHAVAIELPESERAAEQVLSLPVHPGLREADIDRIAASVNGLVP